MCQWSCVLLDKHYAGVGRFKNHLWPTWLKFLNANERARGGGAERDKWRGGALRRVEGDTVFSSPRSPARLVSGLETASPDARSTQKVMRPNG